MGCGGGCIRSIDIESGFCRRIRVSKIPNRQTATIGCSSADTIPVIACHAEKSPDGFADYGDQAFALRFELGFLAASGFFPKPSDFASADRVAE